MVLIPWIINFIWSILVCSASNIIFLLCQDTLARVKRFQTEILTITSRVTGFPGITASINNLQVVYWYVTFVIHSSNSFNSNLNHTKDFTAQKINFSIENFFFFLGLFSQPFTNHRNAGEGGGCMSLIPLYPFDPLHRHIDISWAITAEGVPVHIGSSQTQTNNLCFPSASC